MSLEEEKEVLKRFRDIVDGNKIDDTDQFIPMDPKVGVDVIRDEFPDLSEDATQMAFVLASLADVTMGEAFVLKEDNERSLRETYEHYKVWRSLKGE